MLCDNCHQRDAVVNLTTIENNAVRQLHLCEQCAAERGVETSVATPKHPLGEFLQAVQQQSVPDDPKLWWTGLAQGRWPSTPEEIALAIVAEINAVFADISVSTRTRSSKLNPSWKSPKMNSLLHSLYFSIMSKALLVIL